MTEVKDYTERLTIKRNPDKSLKRELIRVSIEADFKSRQNIN